MMNKETLLKVYRLAQEGATDGERAAAETVFERELARRKMSREAFESLYEIGHERVSKHRFYYKNRAEYTILFQVIGKVTGETTIGYEINKRSRKVWFKLTQYQADYARVLFAIYRRELAKEIERTIDAFIQANDIYGGNADSDRELSPDELAEWNAMMRRALTIDPVQVNRLIESNSKEVKQ